MEKNRISISKSIIVFLLSLFSLYSIKPLQAHAYESLIEDGAVYFINNSMQTNIRFDVPNSNYNVGTPIIAYTNNGFGNQRFILKK